jgi:hypothetical protein
MGTPRTWADDTFWASFIMLCIIFPTGIVFGLLAYFLPNTVGLFLLGFNFSRSVYLWLLSLISFILLLSTSLSPNDPSGKSLSMWNPYVFPDLLSLVFGVMWSLLGGISIGWIVKGKWKFFMRVHKGFIGLILAGNWAMLFAEC